MQVDESDLRSEAQKLTCLANQRLSEETTEKTGLSEDEEKKVKALAKDPKNFPLELPKPEEHKEPLTTPKPLEDLQTKTKKDEDTLIEDFKKTLEAQKKDTPNANLGTPANESQAQANGGPAPSGA